MNNDPNDQSTQNNTQAQPVQQDQDDQQKTQQTVVSVPVGGSEGAPARVEKPTQSVENYIQSSEVEPEVSPEVAKYVQPTPRPKINADAQAVGVKPSIPTGPVYGDFPTNQVVAAQAFKVGDSSASNTWRALIAIKEFAKGLFGIKKPQEAH